MDRDVSWLGGYFAPGQRGHESAPDANTVVLAANCRPKFWALSVCQWCLCVS